VISRCVDCEFCRKVAPDIFGHNAAGHHSYAKRQPKTAEEVKSANHAIAGCCVDAIRGDGEKYSWTEIPADPDAFRRISEVPTKIKRWDAFLGSPIAILMLPTVFLAPVCVIALLVSRFVPGRAGETLWQISFIALFLILVQFTPYLMGVIAAFVFLARLPFPTSTSVDAWGTHAIVLGAIGVMLWRTWLNWPAKKYAPLTPRAAGKPRAPWWGYVLGGLAILGLFGMMAYYFHFAP
jgi:ferredoxin